MSLLRDRLQDYGSAWSALHQEFGNVIHELRAFVRAVSLHCRDCQLCEKHKSEANKL